MSSTELVLRLLAGVGLAFLLGAERSRRTRFVGARTFGLIGLAGAMAGVAAELFGSSDPRVLGSVLQGVLTGVGFVGAGVIMHPVCGRSVHGVTTAAAIWVAALAGFAAGLGEWLLMIGGALLTLLLLVVPEPMLAKERAKDQAVQEPGETC